MRPVWKEIPLWRRAMALRMLNQGWSYRRVARVVGIGRMTLARHFGKVIP